MSDVKCNFLTNTEPNSVSYKIFHADTSGILKNDDPENRAETCRNFAFKHKQYSIGFKFLFYVTRDGGLQVKNV